MLKAKQNKKSLVMLSAPKIINKLGLQLYITYYDYNYEFMLFFCEKIKR